MLAANSNSFAQVNVTSAGNYNFCINDAYTVISNIVISETASGDFADNSTSPKTYILAAPSNFQFDPDFGSVSNSGDDITFIDIAVQTNQIRVIYVDEGNNGTQLESITISDIRVKPINTATGPIDLVRTGGTANQLGNAIADIQEHATFQSFAAPVAGTAENTTICQTETAYDLFNALSGEQSGGVWTDDDATGQLNANLFDASGVVPGTYNFTYTVTSSNCPSDNETVTITVEAPASAGTATNRNICITNDNFNLFTTLTGFSTGGTWSDDDGTGALLGNTLDATGLTVGSSYNFTYTVNKVACSDSETVTITITDTNNAGTALSPVSICDTETNFDLFSMLSGEDAGGTWSNDDGASGFSGSTLDASGTTPGTYNFTYTTATTACVEDSETISITIEKSPEAGSATNTTICESETSFDLFSTLTGYDTGGTWNNDDGASGFSGNTLDASSAGPGTYNFTYTVSGATCVSDFVTVAITIENTLSAGNGTDAQVCINSTSFNLFTTLADYDTGGTWTNDSGASGFSGNTFNPSLNAAGNYTFTYTVSGTSCPNSSESVVITVNALPDANILNEEICDDGVGSTTENTSIDLVAQYNSFITTANNTTITWHDNSPPTAGNQIGTSSTSTPTITDGATYYAKIIDNSTLCENVGSISFSLNQLPAAVNNSYNICENSSESGESTVNLSNYENDVTAGASDVSVAWYNDAALDYPVFTPSNQSVSSGSEYYAKISNNSTGCESTARIDFTVNSLPSAPTTSTAYNPFCVGDDDSSNSISVSGTTIKWYSDDALSTQVATGNSPSLASLGVSTGSSGTFKRYATQTDGNSCESPYLEIDIEILDSPVFSPVPSDVIACSGELINIDFNTVSGVDNITWTSDNTDVGNPANGTDNINFITASNNTSTDIVTTITVAAVNQGCTTPVTSSFTITIKPTPNIPPFFTPALVCEDETNFDLTSIDLNASPAGGTYTYSGSGVTGDIFDASATGLGVQEISVTYQSPDGCVLVKPINLVEVIELPSATVDPTAEICSNGSYDLSNASPAVANNDAIIWSTSGDGSFNDTSLLTPTYTPGSNDRLSGTVTLTITATGNASCSDSSDNLVLSITPAPTADAGIAGETCVNTAFTVNDAAVTNQNTIAWTHNGSGSISNETTDAPTYTPDPADAGNTVTLTLTVTGNGSCATVTDTKAISITSAPTADAGIAGETCVNTAFTVNDASVTNQNTIAWTHNGSGSISNETTDTPTYTPDPADAGNTVTLTLTVTGNGSCATVTDTKAISITTAPTADAGIAGETCVNTAFTVNDAAVTNQNTIAWTHNGSGSISNETTDAPTYTPDPADAGNTVTLTLTVTGNGSCATVTDTKAISITTAPTADAGIAGETCVNTAFTVNDAAVTNQNTIAWTHNGSGSISNETTDTPTYTPDPADAGNTVTLTLTVTGNGSCATVTDTKAISITSAPTADAGIAAETCVNTAFTVNDAAVTNQNTIAWTHNGSGSISNETTDAPTYTPDPADAGNTVTLTLTVTGNGSCATVTDTKAISITTAPTADAGIAAETCVNTAFTVNDAAVTNQNTIAWTHNGSGSISNETTDAPTYTPDPADAGNTVTLTLTVTGNGSCATVTDTKAISITTAPTADAGIAGETCVNTAFTVNDAAVTNQNTIAWTHNGSGSISNETTDAPTYTPDPADAGNTVTLTLTVTGNGSCATVTDTKLLTINPLPSAISRSYTYCEDLLNTGTAEIDLTTLHTDLTSESLGSVDIFWYTNSGLTVLVSDETSEEVSNGATYYAQIIFQSTGCTNVSTVDFQIDAQSFVDAGSNEAICDGEDLDLSLSSVTPSAQNTTTYQWTSSGDGTFDDSSKLQPVYTPGPNDLSNSPITLTLEGISSNTCSNFTDAMQLTINPIAVISPISDMYLCPDESESSITFSADLSGGNFSWSVTNFTQLGLSSGSGTGNFPSFTPQPNTSGTSVASVVTINYELNNCNSASESFTIFTKPTPVIDDVSDVSICPGESVSVSFNANTTGETFSWSTDNNTIGDDLLSSGSGDLNFIAATNDSGSPIESNFTYSAILDGCSSITKTFKVTLNPDPVINPVTDMEVCSFDPIQTNFSSNVAGTTYSWTNDNTNTGIAGSGTGDININAAENLTGVDQVSTIQVKGTANSCEGDVETFTITVKPKPILATVSDINACAGDLISEIEFSDNSSGNSTISWTATNSANIGLSVNSGTGSIPQFTMAANNTTNTITSVVTVTSTWEGCESDQLIFRIRLKPTPLMNPVADKVACGTDMITTTFSNSLGASSSYSWTNDNTDIGLAASGTGDLNFSAATNTTGVPIEANIAVVALNNGCTGPEEVFKITVNPTPQISPIADLEVCSEEFVSIPFNIDLSGTTLSISNSNSAIVTNAPVINGNAIEFTTAINTTGSDLTGTFVLSSSKAGCVGTESFIVTLKNKPVVNSQSDEAELCAGTKTSQRNFSHSSGSGTFTWQVTEPSLFVSSTPLSGSGNFPGFHLAENLTGEKISGYIKYFSTSNGCLSEADSFKVTLKPSPVSLVKDTVFCAGDFVNYEFFANTSGDETYYWTNISGNTTIGINNLTGSTNDKITPNDFQVLNNDPLNDNVAAFEVYAVKDGCAGPVETFEIRVKPRPVLSSSLNYNPTICSGDNFNFSPQANLSNTVFEWELISLPDSVSGATALGTGDINLVSVANTSSTTKTIVYRITPYNERCEGTSRNLSITVYPEINFSSDIPNTVLVCTGSAFTIPLSTQNNLQNIIYKWTVSSNSAGAVNGQGSEVGGVLSNSKPFPQRDTVIYTITPTLNDGICIGPSKDVRVIVKAEERFRIDDREQGNNIICASNIVNLNFINTGGGTFSGPGVSQQGAQWIFNPILPGVTEKTLVTYSVEDPVLNCISVYTDTITVIPSPTLQFTYENDCDVKNHIIFNYDGSSYKTANDSIIEVRWMDLIGNTSLIEGNNVTFKQAGRNEITLEVVTALGCSFRRTVNIEVGNIDRTDFSFTEPITSETGSSNGTQFTSEIQLSGNVEIQEYLWNFDDPNSGSFNNSNLQNPQHNFEEDRRYNVSLIITAAIKDGNTIVGICYDTIVKNVDVVNSVLRYPYFEDFENGPGGWNTEAADIEQSSSWTYIEVGNPFESEKNTSKYWGTMINANSAGYQKDENSYLNIANFNLDTLEKPMLSFDMYLDIEELNRSGAILEYSSGSEGWKPLGKIDDPINWYNNITTFARIGGASNEQQYAWSASQNENWQWVRVAYPLDELKTLSSISLRFNFLGFTNESSRGMAIDNFYLGERSKNVLLELFTNTNSADFNQTINTVESLCDTAVYAQDIIKLEFHTSYPFPDEVNKNNRSQLDSRTDIYGISESSQIVVDGNVIEGTITSGENRKQIIKQSLLYSLVDSLVQIKVNVLNSNEHTVKFNTDITIDTSITNKEDLAIYHFIVEKQMSLNGTELTNVVVQTLPDISGEMLLGAENSLIKDYSWNVNSIFTGDLGIVTLVQNLNTNEILQTAYTTVEEPKVSDAVLSNLSKFSISEIKIYPNPSKDIFYLESPSGNAGEISYLVLDNTGKIVKNNTLNGDERTHSLSMNGFSTGVYYIVFKDHTGNISMKKLVLVD